MEAFLIKISNILLIALLLALLLVSACRTDRSIHRVNSPEGCNLRDAPSFGGHVIALIPDNTELKTLEETGATLALQGVTGRWTKVTWHRQTGWVFGGFLGEREAADRLAGGSLFADSTFADPDDPFRYAPANALDGDPLTAWAEDPEERRSQIFEIHFRGPVRADTIKMMPGYFDSRYWREYNRIVNVKITLDDREINADFSDEMTDQTILLPDRPTVFSTVKIEVRGYKRGRTYNGMCISEIQFFSEGKQIWFDQEDQEVIRREHDFRLQPMDATAVSSADHMTVRDRPDENGCVLGVLAKGDRVRVFEKSEKPTQDKNTLSYWFEIKKNDLRGYCQGYHLDFAIDDKTAPHNPYGTLNPFNSFYLVKDFCVSSFQRQEKNDWEHHPAKAFDDDPATCWMSGAPQGGQGEFTEIVFFVPNNLGNLIVQSGAPFKDFQRYSRPKKITLITDGVPMTVNLEDTPEPQIIPVDREFTRLKLMIDETYPGASFQNVCITGITLERVYFGFQIPEGFIKSFSGKYIQRAVVPYNNTNEYFFSDGTYIFTASPYDKTVGAWKADAEGNIEIRLKKRFFVKGIGVSINPGNITEGDVYKDYIYTSETIKETKKLKIKDVWINLDVANGSFIIRTIGEEHSSIKNTLKTWEINEYMIERRKRYQELKKFEEGN
jgi:hypothetical protein